MFDSRRISLFCPVDFWPGFAALFFGVVGLGWLLMVSLAMNSDSFCQGLFFVRGCGSLFLALAFVGVGVCFSMESLILAQDERWRRA